MQFGFISWIAQLLNCAKPINAWQVRAPSAWPGLSSQVKLPFVRVIGRNSRTKRPYAGAGPTRRLMRKSLENGVFAHRSSSPGGVQSLERSRIDATQQAPGARGNEFSVTRHHALAAPPSVPAASTAGSAAEPKFLTEAELQRCGVDREAAGGGVGGGLRTTPAGTGCWGRRSFARNCWQRRWI
jgi:hypothetical protein